APEPGRRTARSSRRSTRRPRVRARRPRPGRPCPASAGRAPDGSCPPPPPPRPATSPRTPTGPAVGGPRPGLADRSRDHGRDRDGSAHPDDISLLIQYSGVLESVSPTPTGGRPGVVEEARTAHDRP